MRIAFVSQPVDGVLPPRQSSVGIWTWEVARRLAGRDEVTVYARRDDALGQAVTRDGVTVRPVPLTADYRLMGYMKRLRLARRRRPWFASALCHAGYALRVAWAARADAADVIHVHNYSQFVPVLRALNPRASIVLHMHCEWLTQVPRDLVERRLAQADLVLGCSGYVAERIRRAYPEVAGRCRALPNGVDVHRFEAGLPKRHPKGPQVLYVGRVSPEKGIHVLLEAFAIVAARCVGARLDIVGPHDATPPELIAALSDDPRVQGLAAISAQSYRAHLERELARLAGRVRFVGHVPHADLASLYQAADVVVNPSLSEAFGMSLVEAMAVGVPVVATRVGGMVDIVDGGRAGLLVEPADAPGLAQAIVHLLEHDGLRRVLGATGRERARRLYSWETVAAAALEQYRRLAGAGSRTTRSRAGMAATPIAESLHGRG